MMLPEAAPLPSHVGRYEILAKLGQGATGVTYLARRTSSRRAPLVCLKTPRPGYARDPRFVATFRNEAELAVRLEHPLIVPLYDVEEDERGRVYLVLHFVDGMDLRELLDANRAARELLGWEPVLRIARTITSALEYAHDPPAGMRHSQPTRVIHRDICPGNVLLGLSAQVYVTDFGIARSMETASLAPSEFYQGRLAYSAPERLAGERYDHRIDLFSLGVLLFELLTLRRPFQAPHAHQLIDKMRARDRPALAQLRPELRDGSAHEGLVQLATIVERLLEPDPGDRFASAPTLADALGAIDAPTPTHIIDRRLADLIEQRRPERRRQIRLHTGPIAVPDPTAPRPGAASSERPGVGRPRPRPEDEIILTSPEADHLRAMFTTLRTGAPATSLDATDRWPTLLDTSEGDATEDLGDTAPNRPTFDVEIVETTPREHTGIIPTTNPSQPSVPETRTQPRPRPQHPFAAAQLNLPAQPEPHLAAAPASAPSTTVQPDTSPAPTTTVKPSEARAPWVGIGIGAGVLVGLLALGAAFVDSGASFGSGNGGVELDRSKETSTVEVSGGRLEHELAEFDQETLGPTPRAFFQRFQAWGRVEPARIMDPRYHLVLAHAYAQHDSPNDLTVSQAIGEYRMAFDMNHASRGDSRMRDDLIRFACHDHPGVSEAASALIELAYGEKVIDAVEGARKTASEPRRSRLEALAERLRARGARPAR